MRIRNQRIGNSNGFFTPPRRPRPPRGLQPSGTRGRRAGRMQAAEHRFDHYVLLHIFHPPYEPCASPPTVPPQTPSTTSVPTTRPVPCMECGAPAGGVLWTITPPAVTIYRQLSPPVVTVCRDGSCNPPSPPVACRTEREGTPHGGRTAGRGQRWHGKCSLSFAYQHATGGTGCRP